MPYITVGTDLEVFGRSGEHHVALCGKIGGSKEAPLQLPDMPRGFMVQEDNVSLEFNIPPVDNASGFVRNISQMRVRVTMILDSLGLVPSIQSSVSFDKEELTHPNALVFGCESDYNAWTKRENEKPRAKDASLRTAGGHVHVGTETIDMLDGIKYMDLFLGVPSILLDDSPSSERRRELYGKAGAMRPKPYGFEYRTLSNFWMFDDKLINWVFTNTYKAMEVVELVKGKKHRGIQSEDVLNIQKCINTGDKELAKKLIDKYGVPMPVEIATTTLKGIRRPSLSSLLATNTGVDWGQVNIPTTGNTITGYQPVPVPPGIITDYEIQEAYTLLEEDDEE